MPLGSDRILTTHAGSMPRPQEVVDMLFAQDLDDYPEYRDRLAQAGGTYRECGYRDRAIMVARMTNS